MGVESLVLLLTAITAIAAIRAAIAAWKSASSSERSADETRKTVLAQIILQITGDYASEKMLDYIHALSSFKMREGNKFAEIFGRLRESNYRSVEQVDKAQRALSHYFHRLQLLLKMKVVTEKFLKDVISDGQVEPLFEIVEPLEEKIDLEYDTSTFDTFRHISSEMSQKWPRGYLKDLNNSN